MFLQVHTPHTNVAMNPVLLTELQLSYYIKFQRIKRFIQIIHVHENSQIWGVWMGDYQKSLINNILAL